VKMHHIGLYTNNLGRTEVFYETMFGFVLESRIKVLGETITFMKHEEITIEFIQSDSIILNEGGVHFAWRVDSLMSRIKELETKGLIPIEGPFHLENGWKTVFYQGLNLEVIELIEV
jgi:lactoylglutathione lyase